MCVCVVGGCVVIAERATGILISTKSQNMIWTGEMLSEETEWRLIAHCFYNLCYRLTDGGLEFWLAQISPQKLEN